MKPFFEHRITQYSTVAIAALYVLFIQFYRLGELPIIQWDESRLAVNAAEMSQSNNFLVSTFENHPDLYNTKPPLLLWFQAGAIKVFGLSEWSIRLPSALAALACFFAVFYILYIITSNIYYSVFGTLLLASSGGFIQLHGSMTGDYDALLSAFVLAAILYFRSYTVDKNPKALLGFTIFQSLAILCKSAAGLIPIPVYFAILIYFRHYSSLKTVAIAIAISFAPFIVFTGIRELIEPGYLQAIWNNDFHGRFSKALEGHTSEWHYYIVNLFDFRFSFWIWLLVPSIIFLCIKKDRNGIFFSLFLLGYMVFLSLAKTRIHWYDMPYLPLVAIVIALGIYHAFKTIKNKAAISVSTLVLLIGLSFTITDKFNFIVERKGLLLDLGHYELSEMMKAHPKEQKAKYIANWYDAEFYFYTKEHPEISRGKFRELQNGDTVLMGNLYKDSLPLRYEFNTIKQTDNAKTVVITGLKN